MSSQRILGSALSAAAFLVACGGDGDSDPRGRRDGPGDENARRSQPPDEESPNRTTPEAPFPELPFLPDIPQFPPLPGELSEDLERCFAAGGTLEECAQTAGLCALRDAAIDELSGGLAEKLGLFELFKNYYCDGECFHCCWVPGAGPGGSGGGCHTSFDASEKPAINCNPGTYGPGTQDLGPALVIGDSLGLGICIGGVQQVCNHIPICTGAGSSALGSEPAPDGASPMVARSLESSLPPTPNMSHPGAAPLRAKSFEAAIRRHFYSLLSALPASAARRAHQDLVTGRGAVGWRRAMTELEPFDRSFEVFRVTNDAGEVNEPASYHTGVVFHTTLALLGGVPNLKQRLEYIESRFWTEQEKASYLAGINPDDELSKTMSPLALEALKRVPIQDYRLLAKPAPGETPLPYRTYDGVRLGAAPIVTLAPDCSSSAESVAIAVDLSDAERAASGDVRYPVAIDWGDGTVEHRTYDAAQPANVLSHSYATPGRYLVYVTATNSTGLRGVAGMVVENTHSASAEPSAIVSTVQLDDVAAYGPALVTAGQLGLTLEAARDGQPSTAIGWSEVVKLANAGPTPLGDVTGYNETLAPLDSIVLRARTTGAYRYDSVYLKIPSVTLGVQDLRVDAASNRTVRLTADMLQVYYMGASAPVPASLLERDVNGDLLVPLDRVSTSLPAGFCGAQPCRVVDRIEVPMSALREALSATQRLAPESLPVGSSARWAEDVPNVFVPVPAGGPANVPGSCNGAIPSALVAAAAPAAPRLTALTVSPVAPSVTRATSQQLQAMATLADGSTLDVTSAATWSSAEPTVVQVSNASDKGRVSAAIVPGTSSVTASFAGVTSSALVTNSEAPRGFRSYRVLVTEIHGAVGRAGLNGVELIVDDRVLESLMTSEDEGTIGPFAAAVSTSSGPRATYAFDASLGTGWTSANDSFSKTAPFVALGSPVYLQLDFEQQTPVQGVRLHRQGGIHSASYKPQFPKQVVVQGSNDGVKFETLTTHSLASWNGEVALVEWEP